jgi:long-chain acyl-CoA synthetase
VYPEEIENEFQLFEEIDQILVRSFALDKKLKTEGIEALIYLSPDYTAPPRNAPSKETVMARIGVVIAEVNQRLLPYQRIKRWMLLDEPMEMTTTKKIKRDSV